MGKTDAVAVVYVTVCVAVPVVVVAHVRVTAVVCVVVYVYASAIVADFNGRHPLNVKISERTTDQLLSKQLPTGERLPEGPPPKPQIAFPPVKDPLRPVKVAILGTAPTSRMLAPFNDPEWTIWGSSPGNQGVLPRCDAWFEMHCNLLWPEYKQYGEPYIRWLNDQKFPVVAQDQTLIKNAIKYPLRRILDRFGPYFFTSTFAWMMAYAIDVGARTIGLWGVDMSSKDEYILQRAGGHFFITIARQMGIQLVIPEESDLLQPSPLYGYSDGTPFGRKIAAREQEVKERIAQLEQQHGALQSQLVYLKGALEDIVYTRQVWAGVGGLKLEWVQEAPSIVPPEMPERPVPPGANGPMPQGSAAASVFDQNVTFKGPT